MTETKAGVRYATAELIRMKAAGLRSRTAADADIDASLAVLAEEIAGFSKNAVSTACRGWAKANDWWPTLAELLRECEEATEAEMPKRKRIPWRPPERTHQQIMDDMERRCAWAVDIRAICGGDMPFAWKQATADGPVIAVRWTEHGPWVPPGPRPRSG